MTSIPENLFCALPDMLAHKKHTDKISKVNMFFMGIFVIQSK
ncbi:hypothetical protein M132_0981 [Bacteroides fragilis str. S24L15]|nr:hypothetical protein M132_0981 [Bacteroides fragilis str. S24L15]EYA76799.1 hypothetical protein M133_1040 [Bacteroides fragilis str. S24L26]EYA81512.1 hypothetical protein M134_1135 [Bacteroides fragilis str. S24L34]